MESSRFNLSLPVKLSLLATRYVVNLEQATTANTLDTVQHNVADPLQCCVSCCAVTRQGTLSLPYHSAWQHKVPPHVVPFCTCAYVCMHAYMHTYIYTYIHAYMRTYELFCMDKQTDGPCSYLRYTVCINSNHPCAHILRRVVWYSAVVGCHKCS